MNHQPPPSLQSLQSTWRLLLLVPPNSAKLVMEREHQVNDEFGTYPPLGLLSIATYLKRELGAQGFDLRLIDCSVEYRSYPELAELLRTFQPHMVGLTAMTPMVRDLYTTCDLIKQTLPHAVTVIGGPHVTTFAESALAHPSIDYAIMGDGEYPLRCLIEKFLHQNPNYHDVPNLIYRTGGAIKKNLVQHTPLPIDELPIPDRTLLRSHLYRCPISRSPQMATLISSRGCPFHCTFCNSIDKVYRPHSLDHIMTEVQTLHALGFKEIFFFDDLFGIHQERLLAFAKRFQQAQLPMIWSFKARVHTIDLNTAYELKKANCHRIHFGIETHRDDELRMLKKGITVAQIRTAVQACRAAKIQTVGSFMINLPGDSVANIQARFQFANGLGLDYCQYAILVAYAHSEIFDWGVQQGQWPANLWQRLVANPWADFEAPILDNGISRAELDQLITRGLKSFYLRPQLIAQRIRQIQSFSEFKKLLSGGRRLLQLHDS